MQFHSLHSPGDFDARCGIRLKKWFKTLVNLNLLVNEEITAIPGLFILQGLVPPIIHLKYSQILRSGHQSFYCI
jgi:hypothetical protein